MLQVAFATDDRVRVNQHFGASVGFAIYALDGERARLVSVAEFAEESMDGNESEASAQGNVGAADVGRSHNKLPAKIAALSGCAAVYCLAVGGSAVRQLIAAGVQPIRLEEETSIERLLGELQKAVREGGVPWVEKALNRDKDAGRFDRMAEEGWQE
jgi:nitrogen fixation protein NifX